jgi:hypothetical protein
MPAVAFFQNGQIQQLYSGGVLQCMARATRGQVSPHMKMKGTADLRKKKGSGQIYTLRNVSLSVENVLEWHTDEDGEAKPASE